MFFRKKRRLTAELEAEVTRPRAPFAWDRFVVFLLLLSASTLILSQALIEEAPLPEPGDIAEQDIFAPMGFTYRDTWAAEKKWNEEMLEHPAPYIYDLSGHDAAAADLRAAIAAAFPDSAAGGEGRRKKILRSVDALLQKVRDAGLLDRSWPPDRVLSIRKGGRTSEAHASTVLQPGDWKPWLDEVPEADLDAVSALVNKHLLPTLKYDAERRNRLLLELQEKYPPKEIKYDWERPLIVAGEEIEEHSIDLLRQLREYRTHRHKVSIAALIALLAMTLSAAAWYMKRYLPSNHARFRDVAATAFAFGAVLLCCLIMKLILDRTDFGALRLSKTALPVASLAMALSLLYGTRLAFVYSVVLSILVGVVITPRVPVLVSFLCGSMTASMVTAGARKRSDLIRSGGWTALVQLAIVITTGIIAGEPMSAIQVDGLSAILSGFLSSFIVPAILLPVEAISRRTSSFRLLELTDLNQPLLQLMHRKAPGTFQHSQHVALLAQTAAEAIGANSLLTRVGAYFHDIGKIKRPEYFTENQLGPENPHDKLKPSRSASIVRAHVTDGKGMAEEARLPDVVIDFITQHHGTAVMGIFYHRALEMSGEEGEVDRSDFQYPGPKPQIRETAIVMLADAAEAATRSLAKKTTQRLEKTVRRVITEKFEIGELDECDLTLRDLNRISEAFTHVLSGMYHTRQVAYPDAEEIAEAERRVRG